MAQFTIETYAPDPNGSDHAILISTEIIEVPDEVSEPSPVQVAAQTIKDEIAARLDETVTTVAEAVQAINDGLTAAVDILAQG